MKVGDVVCMDFRLAENDYFDEFIQVIEKGIVIDRRERDYTDIDPERQPTNHDIDLLVLWSSTGILSWVPMSTLKLLEINDGK